MKLNFLKTDTKTINPKKRIYITGDYDKELLHKLSQKIIKIYPHYIICFEEGFNDNRKCRAKELKEMSLVLVIVTNNYFQREFNNKFFDLYYSINQGIPLLPITLDQHAEELFNINFGSYHCLKYYSKDFDNELERYINEYYDPWELLVDREEKLETANVFISYRKKEKNFLNKLLNIIYSNSRLTRIVYWYDRLLIPGVCFKESIKNELESSDFVILLVTDSIFEKGNYVLDIEYPMAVKLNKTIIPVIAKSIDLRKLKKFFPHTEKPIFINHIDLLEDSILKILKNQGISFNEEFSKEELRIFGQEYLKGNRGKQNIKRGVAMLEKAAFYGDSRACKELGEVYLEGLYVKKNILQAIKYFEKSFEIVFKEFNICLERKEKARRLYNYGSVAGNLARPIMNLKYDIGAKEEEILYYLERYYYICEKLENEVGAITVKLNKGWAYLLLAIISSDKKEYKKSVRVLQ